MAARNKRGRVSKVVPSIPDTFENLIQALVKPVRTNAKQESNDH